MVIGGIYESIVTGIFKVGTTPWFRIYTLLEFFALLYFYNKLLGRNKLFLLFSILYIMTYLYQIYEWVYFPRIGFNFISLKVEMVSLVLISSLIWFVDAFKKMEETSFYVNPVFYIIAAFLLYFCSTFIVFVVTDYMKQYKMNIRGFYMIILYAALVLRITLLVVFWKASRIK
ncbi:hypothetical protein KK2020170_11680 [Flavobacterium okayamense]|uniref:Uncharacterized protein n=2 Tax=Flavobacterium okayamense TaxID=2830782 RepID=A0ABM7S499_9FLAO|nr:hypothetical protein KK2020170_11680 [Flavobacterium okayamense]